MSDARLTCADPHQPSVAGVAHYELGVFTGSPPGNTPIPLTGSKGAARSCLANGECHDLPDATLTFQLSGPGEMDGIGGTLRTLRFTENGATVVKTFHTQACHVRQVCG